MADRDVDVNLNVQVQGEKNVDSLNASLNKLSSTAKTSTTTAATSVDKIADKMRDADAAKAVKLLYASHKGEKIGEAIRNVVSKVFTRTAPKVARDAAKKQPPVAKVAKKKAADKASDDLDTIRKSVKGLSIAGGIAAGIYTLKSALQALGVVGHLLMTPFKSLYSFLETTFNYTKEFAQKVLEIAPKAAQAHMTLAQAMTDSATGAALLGKAYESLNEKAVETYKKIGLKARQYTKPGGQIASMLDMTQYIAGRYGRLETKLEQAKTPKAKKLAEKMLTNYRDLMVKNLPAEVANVAMTISKSAISQFRQAMKFIDLIYSETGPRFTDKAYKQKAAEVTMGISLIGRQWEDIKTGIAKWSIDPIRYLLQVVNEKMQEVGPQFKDLAGALSAQAWNTLTEALKQINVDELKKTFQKWTKDVLALDPKKLGQTIGASLSKIGNAILQVINYLVELAPKLERAIGFIDRVLKAFGVETIGEKAAREAQERKERHERVKEAMHERERKAAEAMQIGREKVEGGKLPEFPPASEMSKMLQGSADAIRTNGVDAAKKIGDGIKTGSADLDAKLIDALAKGGTLAGQNLVAQLSSAHITVSGGPSVGTDRPAP